MALCCIGGVCIPYSALIPLLIYGLKWILSKLSSSGILPDSWRQRIDNVLNSNLPSRPSQAVSPASPSCCSCTEGMASNDDQSIVLIQTKEQWDRLFVNNDNTVICKFTADWCGPCKTIQPYYEKLANQYCGDSNVLFCLVNVDHDDVQEIVRAVGVTILPNISMFNNSRIAAASYIGSDETKIKEFMETNIPPRDTKKIQ